MKKKIIDLYKKKKNNLKTKTTLKKMGNLMTSLTSIASLGNISGTQEKPEAPDRRCCFGNGPALRTGTIQEALNSDSLEEMAEYADSVWTGLLCGGNISKEKAEEIRVGLIEIINSDEDDTVGSTAGGIAYSILHCESKDVRQIWTKLLIEIFEHYQVKPKFSLE